MEPKRTRTILISCGVILIVTCICLGLIFVSGVGVSLLWPFGPTQDDPIPTSIRETWAPTQVPNDESPTEDAELPDDLAETITQVESQVMEIRGLELLEPVDRTLISSEELEDIVAEDFFAEYTEQDVRQDVMILSFLGLLPEDFDLKALYSDLYSEQIAGFYDDEIKAIYVVQSTSFGGGEKLTYAHEFNHVLQDQTFSFEEGLNYNEESCEEDSERCVAIQALIEGDSSMTEILWFQTYATREDYSDLMQSFENFESPILDAAPEYIEADLYFPYEKGMVFVEFLYDQGGFEAIDAAFQDPPLSTEQILHPEKYPDDVPQRVTLPDLSDVLDSGWTLLDQNVMGEWYTFLILNKAYSETYRLGEKRAADAAEGWGGDAYAFYLNESTDELIFVLDTYWDTVSDAEEFTQAFERYADLRWSSSDTEIENRFTWIGSESTVGLILDGDRTIWVMAPDADTLELILSELQ